MSMVADSSKKSLLGLRTLGKALEEERVCPRLSLPEQFDWRSRNGGNYLKLVKKPGQLPTSVSFAAAGVMESLIKVKAGCPLKG